MQTLQADPFQVASMCIATVLSPRKHKPAPCTLFVHLSQHVRTAAAPSFDIPYLICVTPWYDMTQCCCLLASCCGTALSSYGLYSSP